MNIYISIYSLKTCNEAKKTSTMRPSELLCCSKTSPDSSAQGCRQSSRKPQMISFLFSFFFTVVIMFVSLLNCCFKKKKAGKYTHKVTHIQPRLLNSIFFLFLIANLVNSHKVRAWCGRQVGPGWTRLDQVESVWTRLDQFGPGWTRLWSEKIEVCSRSVLSLLDVLLTCADS